MPPRAHDGCEHRSLRKANESIVLGRGPRCLDLSDGNVVALERRGGVRARARWVDPPGTVALTDLVRRVQTVKVPLALAESGAQPLETRVHARTVATLALERKSASGQRVSRGRHRQNEQAEARRGGDGSGEHQVQH